MKYIPILFSTPMVQAIMKERKTKTRRTTGLDIINEAPEQWKWRWEDADKALFNYKNTRQLKMIKCPYGQPGDVLWVRETFQYVFLEDQLKDGRVGKSFLYKANEADQEILDSVEEPVWRPNIHMTKTACRIFLQIESITLERLQDITEAEAAAEGIVGKGEFFSKVGLFIDLWVGINGRGSWNNNPWVWVIEFTRIDKPTNFLP